MSWNYTQDVTYEKAPDPPSYYKIDVLGLTVTPFDLIEALGFNFNLGCVIKYVFRAGRKGPALDDLRKARNCLDREIARLGDKS